MTDMMAPGTFDAAALARLRAADNAHHLHPFTDHQALRNEGSRIIVGGKGCYIEDAEGNRILDGMAGLWCVNVGYGRQELIDAASKQLNALPYYNSFFKSTTVPAIELAERLIGHAPAFSNVLFGSSGSEANDTLIRLIRHYWALEGKPGRQIIIARQNAYHGSTIASASMGGMKAMHSQLHTALGGFHHIMAPYWFGEGASDEDLDSFGRRAAGALEEAILQIGPDKVAAFVGEPVQGAGGVKIAPPSYWVEIERICHKYDILLAADEVITGFGRTGHWFGHQYYGFTPDLMSVAKGISSGYLPLSAVLVGERVSKGLIERGGEFYHGYTYSGHPAACAVALANLDVIEKEQLVERVRDDTGPAFAAMLAPFASHPLVGEVRTLGLLAAIELVADKTTRQRFAGDGKVGTRCRDHCFANDFVMRAVGDTMILSPPLVIDQDDIVAMGERIQTVLDLTYADTQAGFGAPDAA
jgi:putrescine aminotransferase